jgi:hypothetical protein
VAICIFTETTDMTKRVTFNGIELFLPKYDGTALTIFDYLDKVIAHLEKGLDTNDGSFQISLNVDFSTDTPPKHTIHANRSTNKKTKDKVAKILKQAIDGVYNHVSGSVKVNLLVEDK